MSANPTAVPMDPLLDPDASISGDGALVNRNLVVGHLVAGLFFLIYALITGFAYYMQLWGNYPFPNIGAFSAGKISLVFTNVFVYGFIFNVNFAAMYWAVPALMKRKVAGAGIGNAILGLWNLGVILTILGIQDGYAQTLPWGETPNGLAGLIGGDAHIYFADELFLIAGLLLVAQFIVPLSANGNKQVMPVGGWFILGGLVWFLLNHVVGSYGYELFTGAAASVFAGLYVQGVVGLTLAAIGWGLLYYYVPAILQKPIWSYSVSVFGFAGLGLFYMMSGMSQQFGSTVPQFAQDSGVLFAVGVHIATLTLILNFFMSLQGKANAFEEVATRYFFVGMGFYVLYSLIALFAVQDTLNTILKYSEWEFSMSWLLLYGVFGFWLFGVIEDLFPRLINRLGWYSDEINEWTFWLNVIGVFGFVVAGLIGGAIQGSLWQSDIRFAYIQDVIGGFWEFQMIMIGVLVVANSLLIYNMVMTLLPQNALHDIEEVVAE